MSLCWIHSANANMLLFVCEVIQLMWHNNSDALFNYLDLNSLIVMLDLKIHLEPKAI